jgi:hypothetical protein
MVEQRSSEPFAWVRFLLLLHIITVKTVRSYSTVARSNKLELTFFAKERNRLSLLRNNKPSRVVGSSRQARQARRIRHTLDLRATRSSVLASPSRALLPRRERAATQPFRRSINSLRPTFPRKSVKFRRRRTKFRRRRVKLFVTSYFQGRPANKSSFLSRGSYRRARTGAPRETFFRMFPAKKQLAVRTATYLGYESSFF